MSIIIMLIFLSILILVHEAGHFLAAKAFGMKVDKFGFGLPIGPTLYETQIGDVKVLIHAFLLGGYVSFPDDEKDCELPEDSQDRFLNRPLYQRAIVVSAGVFSNVVCALFFILLTAAIWKQLPSGNYNVYVNDIVAEKTDSVMQSGLKAKDLIVSINGIKVTSPQLVPIIARLSKPFDGKVSQSVLGENLEKMKQLNPAYKKDEIIPEGVTVKLIEFNNEPAVKINHKVAKGLEKYKNSEIELSENQIKLRDSLQGKSYLISDGSMSLNDITLAISDNVKPIKLKVQRNGQIIDIKPIIPNKDGRIGIRLGIQEIFTPTKTPFSIVKYSCKYLYTNTYMMIDGLCQIFKGKIPLKDLHGIVAITKVGGDIIENNGIYAGMLLAAIISMDLALINFLPIPALDGGHILFIIIEKLRGKPISEKLAEKISSVFFMLLIGLMILVVFNDIFALITRKL